MGARRRKKNNALTGEDHPGAVLTEKLVCMLREKKKKDGTLNCSHWARKIGVHYNTIVLAVNPKREGGTWKDLKC